jgi:hypothetical protein
MQNTPIAMLLPPIQTPFQRWSNLIRESVSEPIPSNMDGSTRPTTAITTPLSAHMTAQMSANRVLGSQSRVGSGGRRRAITEPYQRPATTFGAERRARRQHQDHHQPVRAAPRLAGVRFPGEHLTSPTALLAWSRRVGLGDAGEARAIGTSWRGRSGSAGQALLATLDVRESVYGVLAARLADTPRGPGATAAALEHLALRWAAATARFPLVTTPDRPADVVVGTDPAFLAPDRLAFAAVELLRAIDLAQMKKVPGG